MKVPKGASAPAIQPMALDKTTATQIGNVGGDAHEPAFAEGAFGLIEQEGAADAGQSPDWPTLALAQ
jgi:hypothetical protein